MFIMVYGLRASIVARQFRLAFFLEPGLEVHQARMLLAQRSDIGRVADLVEEIECAGDLRVLLADGLNWNLGIGDRASGRASDGGVYLWHCYRVSCDLDWSA